MWTPILERSDGRWIAAEIKLGGGRGLDDAAAALLRLRDKVNLDKAGEPAKPPARTPVA